LSKPDQRKLCLTEKRIWLVSENGDGLGVALANNMHGQGHQVVILDLLAHALSRQLPTSEGVHVVNLRGTQELHIMEVLQAISEEFGSIGGFIHTHPAPETVSSLGGLFQKQDEEIVKLVFFIAKHLKVSLNASAQYRSKAYFVTVTRLDGQLGTSGNKVCSIISGGLSGLVKSLHREWLGVYCRHIDLEPAISANTAADIVLEEIADSNSGLVEIGRTQAERMTLTLESATQKTTYDPHRKPNSQTVFLVSGGGHGVTADCVVELASAYKSKFILVGRTVLQSYEPDWAGNCTDEQELRKRVINEFTRQGKRLTPVEVNKVLQELTSQREIRHTLEKVERSGGEAVYISADVTCRLNLMQQVEQAQQEIGGSVTAIIHGAGNLADKRIEKKTQEDFDRVFEPKVRGLENLISVVAPARLKQIFLFSSVSGYFGNAGQTDYAIANEILNKFAYSCKHLFPEIQVTSINWGPWDKGMMNPTLKKFYEQQRIDLISVELGVQFCRNEFWIANECASAQIIVSGPLSLPNNYHLENLQEIEIKRVILDGSNVFMKDHVIDQYPVLPATCAVNWMVKSCEDVLPNYKIKAIENFKVLKGIVFDDSCHSEYFTTLTPTTSSNYIHAFDVRVNSQPASKNHRLYHYSAKLSFGKEWEPMPIYTNLDLQLDDDRTYAPYGKGEVLFHGKTFQGVDSVLQINHRKITLRCNLHRVAQSEQGQFFVNSFNPFLADVQLQSVVIWAHYQLDKFCLPMGFERIEQFQPLQFEQDFYVSAEISSVSSSKIAANIFAHNERGEIYIQWNQIYYIIID
jgi:NAD(P)-dependent dehydrogenase (short-subunit alcohol dehydrogenase family)